MEVTTTLGPAPNGHAWPYVLLAGLAALGCFYLALDLYLTFATYGSAPASDYTFVIIPAAIGMLCLLLAIALWFHPWSRATLRIGPSGLCVQVTGLGAVPETPFEWSSLATVEVMILPRSASLITFHTRDGEAQSAPTVAISASVDTLLNTIQTEAQANGYTLTGAPLTAPAVGHRSWQVSQAETTPPTE